MVEGWYAEVYIETESRSFKTNNHHDNTIWNSRIGIVPLIFSPPLSTPAQCRQQHK